jgi:carbonic anhydrase
MEFASFALGSKLIVVLGHTKCGAVAAACKVPDVPGHIVSLINAIKPAAAAAKRIEKEFGNHVETTVRVNVAMEVNQLRHLEPVLAKKVASGEIQIVGGVYDLATGKVEFLPEEFIKRFAN